MNAFVISDGKVAAGDPGLVGDQDDGDVGLVEARNRFGGPGEEVNLLGVGDIMGVLNEGAVTVEEDDAWGRGHGFFGLGGLVLVVSLGAGGGGVVNAWSDVASTPFAP